MSNIKSEYLMTERASTDHENLEKKAEFQMGFDNTLGSSWMLSPLNS